MTAKEVNKKFMEFMQEFYCTKLGFTAKLNLNRFIKNEFYVSFPISTYPGSITVRPDFIVENPEIKEILLAVFGPKQAPLTCLRVQNMNFAFECGVFDDKITYSPYNSIMPEYTHPDILSVGSYYYDIDEYTDLAPILEDHKYYMEKVTFPFFGKMSTLEGIDLFLNSWILEGDMNYFLSEVRQKVLKRLCGKREILSGIIAAKLMHSERIIELLERINVMWVGNDYILNDLNKLIEYLDGRD